MLIVAVTTISAETVMYIANYVIQNLNIDLLTFAKILGIETLYNMILSIILYPLIQRFGYYIENEYKGNKILTRYF